jgi:hypothetical protein
MTFLQWARRSPAALGAPRGGADPTCLARLELAQGLRGVLGAGPVAGLWPCEIHGKTGGTW